MIFCFSFNSEESKKDDKQSLSNSSTRPLSIEGPSTSNNETNSPQPLPNQPRQPTNLQGLLKYAMDAAQSEDTENKPSVYPLDQEVCSLIYLIKFYKKQPIL